MGCALLLALPAFDVAAETHAVPCTVAWVQERDLVTLSVSATAEQGWQFTFSMPVVIFFKLMEEKVGLERDGNAGLEEDAEKVSVLLCSSACSQ